MSRARIVKIFRKILPLDYCLGIAEVSYDKAFKRFPGNKLSWTDSKLRCHLFSCVAALAYHSLIRLWLKGQDKFTPDHAMQSMYNLALCLCWQSDKRKPFRMIEEPDSDQAKILQVRGYKIQNGVLPQFDTLFRD